MVTTANSLLEHFIVTPVGGVAHSPGLSLDAAISLHAGLTLATSAALPQAVGVFASAPDRLVLAFASASAGVHGVVLPSDVFRSISGNVANVLETLDLAVPPTDLINTAETSARLEPLELPAFPTWTADKRLSLFEKLRQQDIGIPLLLRILDGALTPSGMVIHKFPCDLMLRLELVQGLMLLLPAAARYGLTFATAVPALTGKPAAPKLIFVDADVEGSISPERDLIDFRMLDETPYSQPVLLHHPFSAWLLELWQEDMETYVAHLRAIDVLASTLSLDLGEQEDLLRHTADRHRLDSLVMTDATVSIEALQSVLSSSIPPTGIVRMRYLERLLGLALETRSATAAELLATAMDEDTGVDQALVQHLIAALATEPDAVYAFIRTHLNAVGQAAPSLSKDLFGRWLPRLHTAAHESLRVAINDGDSETLISWLRLIAREPAAYQLQETLQQGLSAAQKRAHADGELGYQLLLLTAKRFPAWVDRLLDDVPLLEALPDPWRSALLLDNPEAFASALASGREIALVLMAKAAQRQFSGAYLAEQIDLLWDLRTDDPVNGAADPYRPSAILAQLTSTGAAWLLPEALERLITRAILAEDVAVFRQLVGTIVQDASLFPLVALGLQKSGVSAAQALNLVGQVMGDETISPHQAVQIYLALITQQAWARATLPLQEQVARLLHSIPSIQLGADVLWRMQQIASETRSETIARTTGRRLLTIIEAEMNDTELAEDFARLYEGLAWSPTLRTTTLAQWREWAHHQPNNRLQTLLQALAGKRSLDAPREVLFTTLAVRKLLGKRTLEDFAEAIHSAHAMLQAFSALFHADARQGVGFDPATLRAELNAQEGSLTPDERKILAKDLRELAHLVIEMADNRSRTGLIRRGDDLERALLSGEHPPQNAIEAIKWLSGYFDGQHHKTPDGEE